MAEKGTTSYSLPTSLLAPTPEYMGPMYPLPPPDDCPKNTKVEEDEDEEMEEEVEEDGLGREGWVVVCFVEGVDVKAVRARYAEEKKKEKEDKEAAKKRKAEEEVKPAKKGGRGPGKKTKA